MKESLMFHRPRLTLLAISVLILLASRVYSDTPDFIAGFMIRERALILNADMAHPDHPNRVKPFASMTPDEAATIYHELWHAWVLTHLEPAAQTGSRPEADFHSFLVERADALFSNQPADKRAEIMEEAVGDFIDAVVGTWIQMKRFLAEKSSERREEIRGNPRYMGLWARLFKESYTGYYTRTIQVDAHSAQTGSLFTKDGLTSAGFAVLESLTTGSLAQSGLSSTGLTLLGSIEYRIVDPSAALDDFVKDAEAFGLPTRYIRQAKEGLEGVVFLTIPAGLKPPQADVVMAPESLAPTDLVRVARVLFEDHLTSDSWAAFSEDRFALDK
jgi:hypothetical protein